jgi:hypothetical protein
MPHDAGVVSTKFGQHLHRAAVPKVHRGEVKVSEERFLDVED